MRYTLGMLMVAGLIGCAHQSVEVNVTTSTALEKPTVAPSNPRVGFVSRGSNESGFMVLQLVREAFLNELKVGELVVARNRTLEPTALLKISEIRGMAARVMVVRGQPSSEDEVVLPGKKLREAAEALPLVKTDT